MSELRVRGHVDVDEGVQVRDLLEQAVEVVHRRLRLYARGRMGRDISGGARGRAHPAREAS